MSLEDSPPPPNDSLEDVRIERGPTESLVLPDIFPSFLPTQVSENSISPYSTLSVLEDKWTFKMALTTKSRFLESTREFYEVSVPGPSTSQPWPSIMLCSSKAGRTNLAFENCEGGTTAFTLSPTNSEGIWRVEVSLLSDTDFKLGKTMNRLSTSGDKIWDKVSSRKYVTKKIRPSDQHSYIVIKGALSGEEFARFEKRNQTERELNTRTLLITNSKTTPVQKALFLGYTFLLLKRFQSHLSVLYT